MDKIHIVIPVFNGWKQTEICLNALRASTRGAETIMLLNNDCYVTPETIKRLVSHAKEIDEAIIAPVQRDFFSKRVLCITASTCYLLGFPTFLRLGKNMSVLGEPRLLPTKLIIGGR